MTDRSSSEESLLNFPCDFPVKVLGRAAGDFVGIVTEIVTRHAPGLDEGRISTRPSRDGNFVSVTFVIVARDREQLDALYEELSAHDQVLMAL
jgi:putative lipoic acid-binding regulatory protein